MMVLITYDVETSSPMGAKRLRQTAKACMDYGLRVQNSVFECVLDPAQLATLRNRLMEIIDPEADSIRFYFMGNNWERHVETLGKETDYNQSSFLVI